MAYVLVVRFTANEGEEEKVEGLIRDLAAASREEPGVIHYQGHRDPEDPRAFLMYEAYRDEDAFKAHGETDHFKSLALEQLFKLTERERHVYATVD
jgi:quinol monooxygenase YgiN